MCAPWDWVAGRRLWEARPARYKVMQRTACEELELLGWGAENVRRRMRTWIVVRKKSAERFVFREKKLW